MRWFTALAMVFLVSCAPGGELAETAHGPPFRFNITALPSVYQPWFAQAAADWNAATGKELVAIDQNGPHSAVIRQDGEMPMGYAVCAGICEIEFSNQNWKAAGAGVTGCPIHDLRVTALHELGHVLGAGHSSEPFDIMHTPVPPCGSLTLRDIASIAY